MWYSILRKHEKLTLGYADSVKFLSRYSAAVKILISSFADSAVKIGGGLSVQAESLFCCGGPAWIKEEGVRHEMENETDER